MIVTIGATSVVTPAEYPWQDFPIPGHTGELRAAFLNRDVRQGAIVARLTMGPNTTIPAHVHARTTEAFMVLSGSFVNAGIEYGAGAFFTVAAGQPHGPHHTAVGCEVLFIQAVEVDPTDFAIVTP